MRNNAAKPTLGIAMIGGGLMAKAHTMAWRNLQAVYGSLPVNIRLVVLADATMELAKAGAEQYGYERCTTSWEEAIRSADVDIVDIVTPNWLHRDPAMLAISLGKHIWCEKPLALTNAEALEMTEAAEKMGVKTLVGFTHLRNPVIRAAKKLVEEGEIGRPVSFTGVTAIDTMTDPSSPFTWRQDRKMAGTGAIGDVGAHMISLARFLTGPIEEVAALSLTTIRRRPITESGFGYGVEAMKDAPKREVENDDTTIFITKFANGAIGSIEASRVAAGRSYEYGFTLTGTEGAIRFDQQHMYELQIKLSSDPKNSTGFRHIQQDPSMGGYGYLWPVAGVNISIHDIKFFEAFDLINAIVNNTEVSPGFREGWEIEKVINAVDESSRVHQWITVG